MAAVVRIKRHLNQEPAEALLLASNSKRFKSDVEEKSVFKFCGTIDKQEENLETIAQLVEKSQKLSHRGSYKKTSSALGTKQFPADSFHHRRYKLHNQLRKLEDSEASIQVFDLVCADEEQSKSQVREEVVECNGIPLTVEKVAVEAEDEYVYDVYYADGADFDDSYMDQLLSVQPCFYGKDYEDSDEPEEDIDSNDENHYKNDYPDTEDDEDRWSDGDGDVAAGMSRMNLEVSSASSDASSEEDDFVYSKDYGSYGDDKESPAYIAYKKRIIRQLEEYDDDRGSDYDDDADDD